MKKLIFLFLISIAFFFSCNEDIRFIEPIEPDPVCQMFFKDTSFFEKINGVEYLVYRVCAKEDYRNEIFLFEDIGYMKPKREYFFRRDTVNNCVYIDFYENVDWISSDQFQFFVDYKSREAGKPDQILVLGRYFSINSCDSEWTIKFRSNLDPRKEPYFDVMGVSKIMEEAVESNGFKTITIKKNGAFKSGQLVRCYLKGITHPEGLVLP